MLENLQLGYIKFYTLLFFLLISHQNWSQSFVYFQNNSSLTFSVNSVQTGSHIMESDEWWGMSDGIINPWQLETNVLWSNRDAGIDNGTDFYLTTTLSSGGENIQLKMRLNGNFIGSDMWQSLDGPGFNQNWHSDRNFYSETFTLNGKTVTVKYTSYASGSYDDILFVIQEHDPFPVNLNDLNDENKLNILSYNIFMLTPPIAFSDQSTRAAYIAENVAGYDAIIINEAFDDTARDILTGNLSVEYPYFTDVVDESGSVEDGGVLIFSRWPIEYSEDIVYSNCDADDCLAAKGVMYARLNKLGKAYHIFGTHLQAWQDAQNVSTRQLQMTQLKAFVDSKNIPVTEPIIYGGNFNIEKYTNYLNEYDDMFPILNSEEPIYIGQPYSYDYELSSYADAPYKEHLDYLMYVKSHKIASINTNKTIVLRSISDDMWNIFDLSDHLAVQGYFEFNTTLNILEETKNTIKIYPNPVEDFLNISNTNYLISKITISDGLVNTVDEFNYKNLKYSININVSNLSNGIYFINISNGYNSTIQKFIKN